MSCHIPWILCGWAAAHQALLRLSAPAETHIKILPGKAEKGEMKEQ